MIWLILFIIIIIIIIAFIIFYKKYKKIILSSSKYLKELDYINNKYHFYEIEELKLTKSYDNENFYNTISPEDYLIYQLVYLQKIVNEQLERALHNNNMISFYQNDLNNIKYNYELDSKPKIVIPFLIKKIIDKNKNKEIKHPVTDYTIAVVIILTNINGRYISQKGTRFFRIKIEDIIRRLNDKTNNRYKDKQIWDAISRVERARVSNKMRFAVYRRDHYRCVKCGRKTADLEIDHIIPIAKGGKTEFNNLQTLCHSCNVKKGDTVEKGTFNNYQKVCPRCGGYLKLIYGKYGSFYGCINYPKCTYKESK